MFDELNYRNVPAFYFATPDSNEAFQHTGAACIVEDYDSVILRGSFEISHVSPTQNIEFYFCDGPTVCWNF